MEESPGSCLPTAKAQSHLLDSYQVPVLLSAFLLSSLTDAVTEMAILALTVGASTETYFAVIHPRASFTSLTVSRVPTVSPPTVSLSWFGPWDLCLAWD